MQGNVYSKLKENRFFKVKNPSRKFMCALCNSPREIKYSKHLSPKNYAQIAVVSIFLTWALWPWMGFKALSMGFIVWAVFEGVNKILYRKEIPCPYCGFDATWYRRNVKIARKKVDEFWLKAPAIDIDGQPTATNNDEVTERPSGPEAPSGNAAL
jgi:hypothetical protein